ncbi:molybdenum cofactor biosynthesis protein MoaA [Vitreoscilla filiformis]|uniref:Molybdopterin molybdenumtransferase n=1 Tax=Vitreoscilla filiformis TaxID=63 RepID=A0A221KH71_VITFI|nr:gephyrin-like molybdotransferase Glp [Vitreoscilla filiformis]ASM78394.1 molybdenum cofactor biosynthesis protein MoaA [Vitreoscilla filiformis]
MADPTAPAPRAPQPLLPLDEALARLTALAAERRLTETEVLPTYAALGRVLAQALVSPLDVPPADNTAMDGYALRAADVAAVGTVLPVSQRIPAGVVGQPLAVGTAARIFTGAQVPPGADAVVMQEQCEALPGAVRVNTVPQAGQWVRRRGEDVTTGAVALAAGTRLTPQALGLAATLGAARVTVVRRPRVALFSTGDELVMPGEPLKPGGIYNSNRYTLLGLLHTLGCEVSDLGIVPDNLAATRAALKSAADEHDLILTSGGVSVGEEDHLRPAAQAEGRIELWQLSCKPGKPLAVGAITRSGAAGEALLMGLPGNPVSSFVTFLLTVAPVLRVLQGASGALPVAVPLVAAFDLPRTDKRREFLRARLTPEGRLSLFPNQSSGVLTSAVWADGLIDHPAGATIAAGDVVRFLPFHALMA